MSSDTNKMALIERFPNSSEKEWKRRSKKKVASGVERSFEHPKWGIVTVLENLAGDISVTGCDDLSDNLPNIVIAVETIEPIVEPSVVSSPISAIEPTAHIRSSDVVEIPKGIPYWDFSGESGRKRDEHTGTGQRVTVIEVITIRDYLSLISKEMTQKLKDVYNRLVERTPWSRMYSDLSLMDYAMNTEASRGNLSELLQNNTEMVEAVREAKREALRLAGPNPQYVMWGTTRARKVARLEDVVKISDRSLLTIPKAKAVKEKEVPLRNKMVEGSVWRITRDTTITRWVKNPEINRLCNVRNRMHGSTTAIQQQINDLIENQPQIKITVGVIPSGTEFTVMGKIVNDPATDLWCNQESNGLHIPVNPDAPMAFKDWRTHYYFFNQIKDVVEEVSIPETLVYTLRDSQTGDYFAGWDDAEQPVMTSTFSGSKKYKTASAVKASIRDFTGYNTGMDSSGPEYLGMGSDTKKIDLPPTWELVAVDKTTNRVKSVSDVQDWYRELIRLRDLTLNHGSAVRGVYKKAEKRGFSHVLLINSIEVWQNHTNPLSFEERDDDIAKKIDAVVKNITTEYVRHKSDIGIAFALDYNDAIMAALAMELPDVETKLYDFTTLTEQVIAK